MAHLTEGSPIRKVQRQEVGGISDPDFDIKRRLRIAIWSAGGRKLKGIQKYEAYKDLLPPEVEFLGLPEGSTNCAGYALGLGRSTSHPYSYISEGFDEVDSVANADIYVLHGTRDTDETVEDSWFHVGKVLPDGRAESKWGWRDPIFRHPIDFYYMDFEEIKFYKRKPEQTASS